MLIHFIHGYYCIYRLWQPLTYLYFPYHCTSLIYFSFTMIRMFLYAQIYWLAEFGNVSCLQFNYLRVETLTLTWEDLVGHLSDNLVEHLSVWSPTKLSVRPECLIVDTLGGICNIKHFETYLVPRSIALERAPVCLARWKLRSNEWRWRKTFLARRRIELWATLPNKAFRSSLKPAAPARANPSVKQIKYLM
jgi:hypothetical protein